MSTPVVRELIRRKRDGERLSPAEIRWFIQSVTRDEIPEYQLAAMLMAVYFSGLEGEELAAWADAMLHSGKVLDLSSLEGPKVDKHSTGGVGDKISLPLIAAVAACGVYVPMIAGRGLGHTGGTLDKLEAIPGFSVGIDATGFARQVEEIGCSLIGQTEDIAPADKRLYAMRDVTATIESIPLIASSIMSKKLAEGIDALVLDCKVGTGAFMKDLDRARELARTIQSIGKSAGKQVTACLTNMNQPLGNTVGNALEVVESVELLSGKGPADTRELVVVLGAEMLLLAGTVADEAEARSAIEKALDGGKALEIFGKLVAAQGGDARVCEEPLAILPQAPLKIECPAPRTGVVSGINCEEVGLAALLLGGGRRKKGDTIDPAVGLTELARLGEQVQAGQPLALIHARDEASAKLAQERLQAAYHLGDEAPAEEPLIYEVLRPEA